MSQRSCWLLALPSATTHYCLMRAQRARSPRAAAAGGGGAGIIAVRSVIGARVGLFPTRYRSVAPTQDRFLSLPIPSRKITPAESLTQDR
jgi:hypothetical protein